MTPTEKNLILLAVPLGPAHAEGWRAIWYRLDMWAPVTLRNHLATLYSEGLVQRREVKTNSGFAWHYWRATTHPVMTTHAPSTVLGAG